MLDRLYRSQEDEGFSLIELLVVVAIIGILAAIAIPLFLNQRNSAREASVKSDINGAVTTIETDYVKNQKYPTEGAAPTLKPPVSPGNFLFYDLATSGTSFKVAGCNVESGAYFFYDSSAGGLQTTPPAGAPTTGCSGSGLPTGYVLLAPVTTP